MALKCSLFGHKWENNICFRCGEKRKQEIKKILPTGRTFEEQKEVDLQNAIVIEKSSINPKLHRTEREEDLSFNFSEKWSSAIGEYEDAIYNECAKVGTLDSVDKNIDQCHTAIAVYESFQKYCYKKSKGGQIYFDDMWEHCHNSKNPCFSYIQSTKDFLNELMENHELYKVRYEKESQLDSILLDIIKKQNGIVQRKIYPQIPEVPQATIRKSIDAMVNVGKITKEKKGSSYLLWLTDNGVINEYSN